MIQSSLCGHRNETEKKCCQLTNRKMFWNSPLHFRKKKFTFSADPLPCCTIQFSPLSPSFSCTHVLCYVCYVCLSCKQSECVRLYKKKLLSKEDEIGWNMGKTEPHQKNCAYWNFKRLPAPLLSFSLSTAPNSNRNYLVACTKPSLAYSRSLH